MRHLSIVLVLISCSLLAWNIYDYKSYSNELTNDPEISGFNALKSVKSNLDSIVLLVSQATDNLVAEIEASSLMEEDLPFLINQQLSQHAEIRNVKVAFEPYQFDSDMELFGLTYETREDTFSLTDIIYDYRDTAENLAQWYTVPMEQNSSTISIPYGEGEEPVLMDYSAPIFWRAGAGGQQFIGVVNVIFSLEDIFVSPLSLKGTSHDKVYVVDSQGESILYSVSLQLPDSSMANLFQLSDGQAGSIAAIDSGRIDLTEDGTSYVSALLFVTSEQTGWKIIAKISSSDETVTAEVVEEKLTNVYYSGALFLVLTLLFLYNYFRANKQD